MKHAQRKLKAVIATLGVTLVMCFVALIGMSFAWFVQSDSFTASISVGNVELKVNGWEYDTAALSFDNAQPGGLYAGYFSVTSDGGFAYSCSLSVEIPEDGDEYGLADMLKVYIVPLEGAESVVSNDDIKEEDYVKTLSELDGESYTFSGGKADGSTEYYAVVIVFDTAVTNVYEKSEVSFTMTITATQVGYKD